MGRLLVRLLREECGQDVIEYALLGAFIATVGILAWQSVGVRIAGKLVGWDAGVQNLSKCTPDPGGLGC